MAVSLSESLPRQRLRLAVVVSHAIQYFSPWFAHIASAGEIDLRVFYLWDFGVASRYDREFGHALQWDIPLLDGYQYVYIPNRSDDPGTHHFWGLDNPELIDRLSAWSPDAILLFGYTYLSQIRVMFSRRLRHVPLLLRGDSHDISRTAGVKTVISRLFRRLLFRRFAAFLAVGKANADYYRNSSAPESNIYFVPHCVDTPRFDAADSDLATQWKRELGIPAEATVILYAGKFEPNKRPLDLLRAYLSMARPRSALLMVGAGSLENDLRAAAGDRIGRDVFFAPFQNQSRMPLVYAAADIFVLPSGSETWGLAVNEAMSVGRPVILSSHVGCGPDLILQGETGWIFEAGNVHALAQTISDALADRDRLRDMGRAARQHIHGYSYEAATAGLMDALRAVTSKD
jgi:glycosyltransferase involved in cell wall biosynthesis